MAADLKPGDEVNGVLVLKRLTPTSSPPAWRTHPKRTVLVRCPRCECAVRAHEGQVRAGTWRHGRTPCDVLQVEDLDVGELLEELDADGDLT